MLSASSTGLARCEARRVGRRRDSVRARQWADRVGPSGFGSRDGRERTADVVAIVLLANNYLNERDESAGMVGSQHAQGGRSFVTGERCGVSVERRIRSTGGRSSLVTLSAKNDGPSPVSVMIRERVLDEDMDVEPVRGPHNQTETWHYERDRIEHEIEIPPREERMVIYEISLPGDNPELGLSQPSVVDVEEVGRAEEPATSTTVEGPDAADVGDGRPRVSTTTGETDAAKSTESMSRAARYLEKKLAETSPPVGADGPERLLDEDADRLGLDDLRAGVRDDEQFVEVLTEFLAEYGARGDAIDVLQANIDENDGELGPQWTLALDVVRTVVETQESYEATTHSLREEVDSVQDDVETITESVTTSNAEFVTKVGDLEDAIEGVLEDVDDLEEQVTEFRSTQRRIQKALAGDEHDLEDSFGESGRE